MAEVTLTINGKEITADDGKTILQVVREHQLDDIPTLCYEQRLEPITTCFLCVVEVEGARNLLPSCSTKVTKGMVVRTRTEKVLEARKTCLELLFSDHFADCVSPCALKCPAGVDIQGYLSLVKRGLYKEAIELIKEKNPLPIVCGRVCVRECEVGCRRNILDEPVGIDYIKRFAAESMEGLAYTPSLKPPKNKKVAVVGSGPAGLAASYYLSREGYHVTVYEAMPMAGGMLRYGIPAYRLPRDLLDWEIESIKRMGVQIQCNTQLGRDITLDTLLTEYDSVLLAQGAWGASKMGVDNEDTCGVQTGLEVLRDVAEGTLKELKGKVLVIGGGNTAIDTSRTALRVGAEETIIMYRRTEAEMPAHHEEIEAARHEGVRLNLLVAPKKVITDGRGNLKGLECIRMELGAPDASGRRKPLPVEGSEFVEECDYVLSSIGQYPELGCVACGGDRKGVNLNRRGCIEVKGPGMETSLPGVFAAGDAVSGPATVIEAIAAGRRAAAGIDKWLSGKGKKLESKEFVVSRDIFSELTCEDVPCIECEKRHKMPEREPGERIHDFNEVELGLSRSDTVCEVERCLSCGCTEVDECSLRKYGEEYGALPGHYLGEVNRHIIDDRHPFISIDPNKCIKCGRCIKTCDLILGESALGFIQRGFRTTIAPALAKPLAETNCISCGNCIDSCPTGALSENLPLPARIAHKWSTNSSICSFCSVGCYLSIKTFGRDMRIRSARDKATGEGDYLCHLGRFGSRYLHEEGRPLQPVQRRNNRLYYTGWRIAVEEICKRLTTIFKKYGSNSIGVFLSPRLTNEEIYAGVKFARSVLSSEIVGSIRELVCGRNHHELDRMIGRTSSTTPAESVLEADVILLVNSDPEETHPSFGWRIREAIRKGARLIIINSNRISLHSKASLWIQPRRGTLTHVLSGLMNEILAKKKQDASFIRDETEHFEEFRKFIREITPDVASQVAGVSENAITAAARLLTGEKGLHAIAIYDMENSLDRAHGDLEALTNLLLMTGNMGKKGSGLLLLEKYCNSRGLYDMGAEPGYLPGGYKDTDEDARERLEELWGIHLPDPGAVSGRNVFELLSNNLRGAIIFGENPLEDPAMAKYFRNLEFLAVCDLFSTETSANADIVLPASTYIESGGSFTRFDGKIQHFITITSPPSERTILQIINDLAVTLGKKLDLETKEKAYLEIKKAIPLYKNNERRFSGQFETSGGKARFAAYTLQNTPCSSYGYELDEITRRFTEESRHALKEKKALKTPKKSAKK